jgi:hypothetical protein
MFVKLFDWLLDRDGQIYGDERSRYAWYEAIAGTASVQWIVLPWTLALLVWVVPTAAIWPLAVVMAVFLLTTMLCFPYLQAKNVDYMKLGDYVKPQATRKARVTQLVSTLSMVVFGVGATFGADLRNNTDPSVIRNGLLGGVVGGCVAGLAVFVLFRRKRNQLALPDEEDLAG